MVLLSAFLASTLVFPILVFTAALEPLPANITGRISGLLDGNYTSGSVENLLSSFIVQCKYEYGVGLETASCRNALRKIPADHGPLTFGARDTGNWDVILPARHLSGR